ncbi:MAG: hypothetical protein HY303_02990 [Candidatus Wallbacteria bacterium]|nr:hypothetical protein [Candidatus Wallbacteria bacterium]
MSRETFRLLLLVTLLGVVSTWAYNYSQKMERRDKAEEFVRKYIRLVQANDLQMAYLNYTAERFRKIMPFEKFNQSYGLAFRKMGDLKSYKVLAWLEPGVGRDYYQIDFDAQYARDTGKMRFVMDLENGQYKLSGFLVYGDHWEKLPETYDTDNPR